MNSLDPLDIIKQLKRAAPIIVEVFTEGSCFKLYKILKVVFPQAVALYSESEGHWITMIDDKYYDINGEMLHSYVVNNNYERESYEVEQSADVAHYRGLGVKYTKYRKTV